MSELDYIIKTRRWLHQHPELSMKEFKTTQYIRQQLDDFNLPYDTPLPTATIAKFQGSGRHAIAFRADIDALPIQEENDIDFKSTTEQVMHACGHDGHTTMLLTFAQRLSRMDHLSTTVYLIFQPSEESNAGADQLLQAYTFSPLPEHIFGLHMMPDNEEGTILSKVGPLTASATEYRFFIEGSSAHVANKERGASAIEALSNILNHLSQLQHYHLSGLTKNIIHIGQMNAGEAINTVPSKGYLEGTIRTFDLDELARIKMQMQHIADAAASISGTTVEVTFTEGYPPTINDEYTTTFMRDAAIKTELHWIEKEQPYLFGEDFGFYQTIAPTSFAFLGSQNKEFGYTTGLHTPTFNFDEKVLLNGVNLFSEILQRFEVME